MRFNEFFIKPGEGEGVEKKKEKKRCPKHASDQGTIKVSKYRMLKFDLIMKNVKRSVSFDSVIERLVVRMHLKRKETQLVDTRTRREHH